MASLEEVFNRIKDSKKEQREIRLIYKDALATSKDYQDILVEFEAIKDKKKKIEQDVKVQFKNELEQLEGLKLDIKTDNELLGDLALTQLMKGETVEITDEYENKYQPAFSVRFIKAT
ncbi:hypothetical protein GW933_02165 [Candidatus Falkowbacteria bacterium]|uniref:Uncharacterized protein n=1 Tax=Candidatus Buchananbacteria bacterium CG10_big_fil_rev_8_21_14_0_10_33_19 TaxID=1974525 RepID=A0A2H0W615_9BACT|nr:hypothetical protein [Candidatus Falkowbacteria bacterium]PIS06051.1 MAG: hypothetical protein COT80_04785 [Candidatus Buchananbacteria bacterium CG10_big_fil_rev_8_21_14_0_10_33_19]